MPRARSRSTPRYRRLRRSMSTPPRKGTSKPGSVTTMTCRLTLMVECVAERMYQLTAVKFKPLPNSETSMATKKNRKPRCCQISFQSTRVVVGLAIGFSSLLSYAAGADGLVRFRKWHRAESRSYGPRSELRHNLRRAAGEGKSFAGDFGAGLSRRGWYVSFEDCVLEHHRR